MACFLHIRGWETPTHVKYSSSDCYHNPVTTSQRSALVNQVKTKRKCPDAAGYLWPCTRKPRAHYRLRYRLPEVLRRKAVLIFQTFVARSLVCFCAGRSAGFTVTVIKVPETRVELSCEVGLDLSLFPHTFEQAERQQSPQISHTYMAPR
jgi:hypothetical protein